MGDQYTSLAALAMRQIVSFDYREPDKFEIRAFEILMRRHPHLEQDDYAEAIIQYHDRPRPPRMKAGDLIDGARKARERRMGSRELTDFRTGDEVPRPTNYKQMLMGFTQIVREFKDQGIINPSNDELIREYDRRVKENTK